MRKKKHDLIDFIILLIGICFIPYILLFKFLVSLFKNNSKTVEKHDDKQTFHRQNSEQAPKKLSPNDKNISGCKAKIYTDIIVPGEEEKSQAISQNSFTNEKCNHIVDKEFSLDLGFKVSYGIDDFISDMKRYETYDGKECNFVPFMQYYPTYNSMNVQQRAWYFYWRSEIRKGICLNTDLSYIFIYVYELLSGCGYKDSRDGYNLLFNVWKNYRSEYPKLDRYLFQWLFDYTQLHNLDFIIPDWDDILLPYNNTVINWVIEKHVGELPLKLPFVLIDSLCDYSLVKSRFYNDGHQLLMNEAIPRVLALVDAALFKKTNKGLLNTYGPACSKKQSHYIFGGANCANSNKQIELIIKDYLNNLELRSYINALVRYTENVLRKMYNYKGKLKGVVLDEEIANLIQAFLRKEYSPQKSENLVSKKSEIKLDFDNIANLRNQSNAVRDALEVIEESKQTDEPFTDLSPTYNNDEIQEQSKAFDDILRFNLSMLNDELQKFLKAISPLQIEIVYIILLQNNVNSLLEKIANEEMSMPEILIDGINDIAQRYIDDILIDTFSNEPFILEQYSNELKKAIK